MNIWGDSHVVIQCFPYSPQAPSNKRVKLVVKDFVLEREPCVYDYLAVYDGKTSGKYRTMINRRRSGGEFTFGAQK